MKKIIAFDRWCPHEESTWIFQVFKAYDEELEKNIFSFYSASKYVYKKLGESGAKWNDLPTDHFAISVKKSILFQSLKGWSDSFNAFSNWNNLNTLMGICSNFETYLESVITLSIESDPGILFGASKSIDGVKYLKYESCTKFNIKEIVTNCVKGDWNSRWSNIVKLFPNIPNTIEKKISDLERIRKLRNNIAHAFGRDIESSRQHIIKQKLTIDTISERKVQQYKYLLWGIAKEIDSYLLNNHIGEYQFLCLYHSIYPELNHEVHSSMRAVKLKKKLGNDKICPTSKELCKQIVLYYENL